MPKISTFHIEVQEELERRGINGDLTRKEVTFINQNLQAGRTPTEVGAQLAMDIIRST